MWLSFQNIPQNSWGTTKEGTKFRKTANLVVIFEREYAHLLRLRKQDGKYAVEMCETRYNALCPAVFHQIFPDKMGLNLWNELNREAPTVLPLIEEGLGFKELIPSVKRACKRVFTHYRFSDDSSFLKDHPLFVPQPFKGVREFLLLESSEETY